MMLPRIFIDTGAFLFEEQCYPPEEMFREEFIKRVKEGKVISFKDADELNAFLESIESE